jgi:hypothetical protein
MRSRVACWGVCFIPCACDDHQLDFLHTGVEVLLRVTADRANGSLRALIHADLSDGELVVLTK